MIAKKLSCAVYTRKSTEEGLDQDFNSLDAQYEACTAFVTSQLGLGWKLVADRYDDGGISGGTMERPALQRLLQDIRDGKIDVVVVYKIDRLTRSLMDFSRIVDIFDAASVSFVSVTQQFNTTTSMGRLTLNVLLSFAQFEREVTAERIRDKIAASKKKGMWMGGTVPLGYRVFDRKLVIDEPAADEVRNLFDCYLKLGSVPKLIAELNRARRDGELLPLIHADTGQGRRRPSSRIGYGKVYYMLSNPIYIGKVRYGGELHLGEHQAIIDQATFDAVQNKLGEQAPRERGSRVTADAHLLTGILFDDKGTRLSPIHATKRGKRYRYYIAKNVVANGPATQLGAADASTSSTQQEGGCRIAAGEIESIVIEQLKILLGNRMLIADWLAASGGGHKLQAAFAKAEYHLAKLSEITTVHASRFDLRRVIETAFAHIELGRDRLRLLVNSQALLGWLLNEPVETQEQRGCPGRRDGPPGTSAISTASVAPADAHTIDLPLTIKHRGVERRLIVEGQGNSVPRFDRPLIEMVARAHAYLEALTDGSSAGRKQVAERFGVHPEDVSRLLPMAFLSPGTIDRILTGRQPVDLSVKHLARSMDLPIGWAEQAAELGL